MNKTININLAGIFFHIDEDAYLKLQRYLEAIKRSFTDSQGRSEIIADIEARISELFSERVQNDKQVVGMKEVDEVIAIMGQPEDYLVDDEIFEDEPKSYSYKQPTKKLFRDTDNSYIGGVSSGLAHYLGIDAVWVRLLWILLTIVSGGSFIFVYILFWILVPEAVTTADKLMMTGEPVNISNIEKKIKKGFEDVSETVKNVDYQKYGQKVKSSSQTFFDAIGNVLMFFLKLFAKFIGVMLIITGAVTIFGTFIALLSFGVASVSLPWMDYPEALFISGIPNWVGALIVFFFISIPAFFILYLGLKVLINNLKSIGNIAKFSLLGLWFLTIISMIIIGVKQSSEFATDSTVSDRQELVFNPSDTLNVKMVSSTLTSNKSRNNRFHGFEIKFNEQDEKVIYSREVSLTVRSTNDSLPYLIIEKTAKGKDYMVAKERANEIDYGFAFKDNQLLLDNFLITDYDNKYRDQNVDLYLYLPEGAYFHLDDNTRSYINYYRSSNNIVTQDQADHLLLVKEDNAECLDCTEKNYKVNIDVKDSEGSKLRINEDGVEIKGEDVNITINKDGVRSDTDKVQVNINEDGIDIKSDD